MPSRRASPDVLRDRFVRDGGIEALNFLNSQYQELDTRGITWHGVDNSSFMNAMARYTHEGYEMHLAETVSPVPCDFFFAKGVSLLYAVNCEELLARVFEQSRIGVFDYTFTTEARIADVVGTGLPVTFLNLQECQRRLQTAGRKLVLHPYTIRNYHDTPDKVTCDVLYGEADLVERYIAEMDHRSQEYESRWHRPLIRRPTS